VRLFCSLCYEYKDRSLNFSQFDFSLLDIMVLQASEAYVIAGSMVYL